MLSEEEGPMSARRKLAVAMGVAAVVWHRPILRFLTSVSGTNVRAERVRG